MKRFLRKTGFVLAGVLLLHAFTAFFFGNGRIDDHYLKFATPSQHALILGNSRSAQAIMPHILDSALSDTKHEGPFFNYSFTLTTSRYGYYYLESIRKKIDKDTRNGIFIVSVDPWSVSADKRSGNDTTSFADASSPPYNMHIVNGHPNWEYLLKNYHSGWGDMILMNTLRTSTLELHRNGWLEVKLPVDRGRERHFISRKVTLYRQEVETVNQFSEWRFNYLKRTINYLQSRGKVFIVRLPIHEELLAVENLYLPGFDSLMTTISSSCQVPYLNHVRDTGYITNDGNHLHRESAAVFSRKLAAEIQDILNGSSTKTVVSHHE